MSFDLKIINGDFVLNNGDLDIITGKDKLIQDILKICLTTPNSSIYNPWYGSFISKTLIGSVLDTNITIDMAKSQLQNALENLKKLQQLQLANSFQYVSPDEHIAGIKEIGITRNNIDPRLFSVTIKVLNRSFKQVSANFTP